MSQRPVYLVVYRNSLFPAHWALWIPSFDAETQKPGNVGKIINVEGDPSSGFKHEFIRNYDISVILSPKTVITLSWTDSGNIIDGINAGDIIYDSTATDVIEEWALRTAAPGPSLRSATSTDIRTRVTLQNCQTWLRQLIEALVENGIVEAKALPVIDQAPKN